MLIPLSCCDSCYFLVAIIVGLTALATSATNGSVALKLQVLMLRVLSVLVTLLLLLSLAILFLVFIHKNIITVSAVMLFVASIVLGFPNTFLFMLILL